MSTGRCLWIVPCLLAILAGCAQQGSLLSRRTTTGTLKASLSRMEYENQQLRREVSSLKTENRQVEDRLVQEESTNGELSARLDDARSLLGNRGTSVSSDDDPIDPGPIQPRKTLPAGRSNAKRKKAPFVQIPGPIETLSPDDRRQNDGEGWEHPAPRRHEVGDAQSRNADRTLWLPIASGVSEPSSTVR